MNSFETTTNTISELNSITNSSSDEHEELLAEMELIERLPTQERLKQAKRRRALQLKKWSDYEKEYQTNNTLNSNPDDIIDINLNTRSSKRKKQRVNFKKRSIKFQDHIVLLDAIMRKDYDEVERLVISGLTPNSANEDGLTAIHQCCIDDSADLLRLLISYGANVNVCDNDLWTPLHAAATCANLEICKILIENQAELLAVNTDGNMPYDICDDEICLEYIESEMAKKGVTQQAIDMKRSETEMRMLDDLKQICLSKNSFDTSFLSNHDKSALLNFTTYFNNTTHRDGSLDLNAKDYNGATLLHIACANGYTSILEFLLIDCCLSIESGAKLIAPSLSVTDNDGWSPLHVATFWGHQKAIEILLEYGADINLRTNNDETVLDLCDDPDIRDYIIQKSKEIESQQQQQAALAAMQKQMQLIYNTNSISNSTNSINESIKKSNADNSSIVNNSTRSLKRTSTGVSRSSSVRRSSFRDKEKAARRFDTSFKDVLFANETDENIANIILPTKNETNEENIRKVKNSKNLTTVVRIVNNTQSNTTSKYNQNEPSKKPYIDDHNNNQLKITQQTNHTNVARIHSNGLQTNNKNTNASISSNSISFASSSNNKTRDTTLDNSGNNSSVAVINVNSLEMNSTNKSINSSILKKTHLNETEDQSSIYFNTNRTTTTMNPIETISKTTTIQPVSNQYNQRSNTNTNLKETVTSDVDGVKYKFKSNETIGAKNTTNNEFCDVNSDSTSSKFTKCSKCLKRCFVM